MRTRTALTSPARTSLALTSLALVVMAAASGCANHPEPLPRRSQPAQQPSQPTPSKVDETAPNGDGPEAVGTLVDLLEVPWGLDFLPDGAAVVTERDSGRVLHVTPNGTLSRLGAITESVPQGEAGLLGVAVSPDFGRLAFGPDGFLYVATGETGNPELAQDPDNLGGKILRITTDGDPAPGNPDPDSPVWSMGHRNVQGLAWDRQSRLWASEFGDSTWDELNLIEKGGNYGWPEVEGSGGGPEFIDPQLVWPVQEASPSGLAWAHGHLWMAGLRGQRLWRIDVSRDAKASNPTEFFSEDYGRLRTVVTAPDGQLWLTTSNKDGRGNPTLADDRIIVIAP